MNTDVQRTHKIVVGIGLALTAAAGMSTFALRVHHDSVAPTTATSSPIATNPDIVTPEANQMVETAGPPTIAEGTTSRTALPGAFVPEPSAAAPVTPPPLSPPPKSARPAASVTATHHGNGGRRVVDTTTAPNGEAQPARISGVSSTPAREDAITRGILQAGASMAPSDRRSAGSFPGTADETQGTADSRTSAAAGISTSDTEALANPHNEVTTTMQAGAASEDSAMVDGLITNAVKSQIAANASGQGADIAVTTIHGVVVLSGTAPTPDVLEHVMQVVRQIKDVRGVDASAVMISSS